MYPKTLNNLIESLKILPGVGQKTAERYALSILDNDMEDVAQFAKSLIDVKDSIRTCTICHNLTDQEVCNVCSDKSRDHNTICVVSSAKEAFSIERMNEYNGVYHVLNGLISTQKGILPEDLTLESLLNRINDQTREVILALNATVEGEMTTLYIAKKLDGKVKTTRLAFGLPIGGHLDYADDMTLQKAFEGRNDIES
ncbi:recombination protein RecR [Erysipelothrix sp. HDW6A]|uniref:recombination mediator RecR n=1 Tax=Erysipelothrix sp. HDW6A TaxID=2714928 RepID=UPI0014098783|nr:recombination mediator RecR [Erysipelothrix sp. HDW6A]QIK56604.1 recombination protein RecR [Erysipelothrix sp. HDW6A]